MTDLDLKAILQQLATVRSNGEPIVTLYVRTHFNDEQARERARVFVRDCARNELDRHAEHPQKAQLERTLTRVCDEAIARIEQSLSEAPKGLAIFACESQHLWRIVETATPMECRLHVNARCHLLQLARLLDDVEPAMIAVVHQRGARLYEVALGGIVNEATIEGPLPRSYLSGGFMPRPANGRQVMRNAGEGNMMGEGFQYERAQKNQRHQEKIAERNRIAAADFLTQRFDQHASHVVLIGPPEVCAAFERALPPRVQERIILRTRQPAPVADSASARDAIVAKALEAVAQQEKKQEQVAVDSAVGEAMRGGLAVLGTEDVVLAVNQRRVHRLILEDDFERTGWMCRNCGALGVDHVERCSYCNGDLAWVEALGEEIAGRVIADDGDVEVVPHTNKLHSYNGIAAMLRQARARGLGVAPQNAPRS